MGIITTENINKKFVFLTLKSFIFWTFFCIFGKNFVTVGMSAVILVSGNIHPLQFNPKKEGFFGLMITTSTYCSKTAERSITEERGHECFVYIMIKPLVKLTRNI